MLLVFITVGVRKLLSANKPLTCYTRVEGRTEAAGRGLGRGKTVACTACSTQDPPSSQRFRLLDDLGRPRNLTSTRGKPQFRRISKRML